jgi:hypothetical protein
MKIIRVGVMNNFNFTRKEIEELKKWENHGMLFVNSNSFVNIKADYQSIITINPYLKFVEPNGDLSNIKACRIKVVIGANDETEREEKKAISWAVLNGIPILITFQRFYRLESLNKFVNSGVKNERYIFEGGWLRPKKDYKIEKRSLIFYFMDANFPAKSKDMIYFCDWNGTGCESCKNCIKLTFPEYENEKVYSLNLYLSGDNGQCIFNCPDCFAKKCLAFTKSKTARCDIIYRNKKQRGETNHE